MQSYESVLEVTTQARAIGYQSINYDLIYGLPLQTLDGLCQTINQVIQLRPDRIAYYSYAHVPWVKPGQRRYTEAHLPSAELKDQLYETGRRKLIQAGYSEIGMDHFTLQHDSLYIAGQVGTLHRNFMGYTKHTGTILIGLGVSSISDSWTALSQNVKNVEEYLALVNSGTLPVVKGHLLNKEDLVIRKHILNIMCSGYTSWKQEEEKSECLFEGLQRMELLAQDGLVLLSENDLKVTGPGKRFLRNICMALDARLWANKPATRLFSIAD
jgi:oxygen-independent coproporphyrinogen-3 oxidase